MIESPFGAAANFLLRNELYFAGFDANEKEEGGETYVCSRASRINCSSVLFALIFRRRIRESKFSCSAHGGSLLRWKIKRRFYSKYSFEIVTIIYFFLRKIRP